jgi:Tol biopolymer transport system component
VIKQIDLKNRIATPMTDFRQVLAGMPSVSPDGKWVAFAGQKNQGQPYDQMRNSIWLVSATGKLQALESNQGRTPAWSPDGQWLAFESDRGNQNHLYAVFLINRSGKGLRQVTPNELNANHPVWSPDGKLLVFSGRYDESQKSTGIAIVEVPGL